MLRLSCCSCWQDTQLWGQVTFNVHGLAGHHVNTAPSPRELLTYIEPLSRCLLFLQQLVCHLQCSSSSELDTLLDTLGELPTVGIQEAVLQAA